MGDFERSPADVIVVGAGPAGLFLAGLLARQRLSVLVLEAADTFCQQTRASTLQARSMSLLSRNGVPGLTNLRQLKTGHFAGVGIDLTLADIPFAGQWKIIQPELTRLLALWAAECGADLRFSSPAQAIRLDDQGVSVVCSDKTHLARHVVGADGSGSTVRSQVGTRRVGHHGRRHLIRADLPVTDLTPRRFQKMNGLVATASQIASDTTRVMLHDPAWGPGTVLDRVQLAHSWAAATGEPLEGLPTWIDRFTDSVLVHDSQPDPRVSLIGDAAFDSIPVGGESLNSAIADAHSLAIALSPDSAGSTGLGKWSASRDIAHRAAARRIRYQTRLLLDTDKQSRQDQSLLDRAVRGSRCLERRLAQLVSGSTM
ncbi:FAD-dependent monooxygenase [Rhodococcus sp. H29-C3]|uniref:FAD-dependent monooxygenase n=1 Tax=Rhodococcus sp. H29-C3 TaxID=3046307 RepID=UPI0024B9D595|nr:FAD-dependent monooxygenase [Rhodococcus sp. H29-C3]MDJ0362340.1 FAD-dependent monooxygenase [Rhodococcus sp. H29-C3]